tara:strand:+ start:1534 stop:4830 length:3297 start_codon:yes stop_codon:yes gene_type:complete
MAITKVTNSLVAVNAIQGTLIADNAITAVHIAQNQVTSVQIADGSITSTQLGANSVDTAELVSGSIDTIHIADDQVTTAKILDANVTTAKIANNAITSALIPDGSITATQLSSSAAPTFGTITTTGALRGPASFTIDPATVGDNTGTVVIAGNLQVDGTTTTVNSTTLSVADKNITIASGAADAAAANDAGLTVTGASATLLYKSSGDKWSFNKDIEVSRVNTNTVNNVGNTANIIYRSSTNTIVGNNASALVVQDGGNVGIGETTPLGTLHVKSADSGASVNANADELVIEGSGSSGISILSGTSGDGNLFFGDSGGSVQGKVAYSHNGDYLSILSTGFTLFHNGGSERMRIDASGRVGIKQTPGATNFTLQVTGMQTDGTDGRVAYFKGYGTQTSIGSTGPTVTIQNANTTANNYAKLSFESGNAGETVSINAQNIDHTNHYGDMAFNTRGSGGYSEKMRIMSNGNVGIGTTSPDHLLEVETASSSVAPKIGFRNTQAGAQIGMPANVNALYFVTGDTERMRIDSSGNVGIGTSSPAGDLHVYNTGTGNAAYIESNYGWTAANLSEFSNSAFTIRPRSSDIYLKTSGSTNDVRFQAINNANDAAKSLLLNPFGGNVGIGTTTPQSILHLHGANAELRVATSGDNEVARLTLTEDSAGTQHGAFFEYRGNDADKTVLGVLNGGTETDVITYKDDGKVGIGTTDPKSTLQVEGGRMGIISSDSSWEQLRIANPNVAEVGIAFLNGATNTEFLSDSSPSFSNAFTLAINPYSCGTDTLAIAHGNVGDSIWHIDGSGNFGYGPNTEDPVSYYEISKTRPNTNQPSDYELKMTLNTYGYVGSGYKLGMLQWLGGDTASAQDNFYAGIGSTALTGTNNSEEGSIDFHVRNGISTTETLAMQIIGKAGTGVAGGGQHGKSVLFPYQGLAIDRIWNNYPGISVLNDSHYGSSLQGEFRFHGTNSSSDAYPGTSGSDFSVDVRTDGSYVTGSDRRRKTNITTISSALSKVKQLTGKRFQTINRQSEINQNRSMADNYEFGFIAQEIESIIPESLKYHKDEDDGTENWNSAYSMNYASVVPLLVNAIKEQDTVIQDLKSRIETLEG